MIAFDENDYLDMECEEYLGEKEIKDFLEKDKKRFKRRKTDFKKATRKRKIAHEIYSSLDPTWEWYNNLHQYSKNKIHCSCCLCGSKTKNKGKRRQRPYNYMPSYNPTIPMQRRIDEMNYELWEEIE